VSGEAGEVEGVRQGGVTGTKWYTSVRSSEGKRTRGAERNTADSPISSKERCRQFAGGGWGVLGGGGGGWGGGGGVGGALWGWLGGWVFVWLFLVWLCIVWGCWCLLGCGGGWVVVGLGCVFLWGVLVVGGSVLVWVVWGLVWFLGFGGGGGAAPYWQEPRAPFAWRKRLK